MVAFMVEYKLFFIILKGESGPVRNTGNMFEGGLGISNDIIHRIIMDSEHF